MKKASAIGSAIVVLLFWIVPVIEIPLRVQIRWAEGVSEAAKQPAAAELGVRMTDVRGDGIWIVDAARTSVEQRRALVQDPRIADTHNLDRETFRLSPGELVTAPQSLAQMLPGLGRDGRQALDDATRPGKAPLVVLLFLALVTFGAALRRRSLPWLARGIPELSPHGLAVFRVVLGLSFIAMVPKELLQPLSPELHRQVDWLARLSFVRDLAASAGGLTLLHTGLVAALGSFALGLMPRLSLGVAATLLTLAGAVRTTHTSIHDWGLPTMALWMLIIVPWQEGFGLSDSWRRLRGRPAAETGLPRGLAVWIPGMLIGVAFLAAAYAKLDTSGLAWVREGAVRYHVIEDADAAPVTWGLALVRSDAGAVALSFGAIAIESLLWLVILFRRPDVRMAFGMAAAGLLTGFYVFQGIHWPGWWALLLAFMPWTPLVDRLAARLPRFVILADGECPLCRRSARILHAIDWFDRLAFADASNDAERERFAPGLDRDAALREMYVVREDGRRAAGYYGYLELGRSVPLLWLPVMIGMVPPVAAAGRRIYARVAAARTRAGRCTDDVCGPEAAPFPRQVERSDVPQLLSRLAIAVIALFVIQQVIVSAFRIESEPLVSDFGMYAYSWESREAFDQYLREKARRYVLDTPAVDGEELTRRLRDVPKAVDVLDTAIEEARSEGWAAGTRNSVEAILREYEVRYGEPLAAVRVTRVDRGFDWTRGAFEARQSTVLGTLDLRTGTITP